MSPAQLCVTWLLARNFSRNSKVAPLLCLRYCRLKCERKGRRGRWGRGSPMGRGVDGTQLSLSSCEFLPERRQLGAIYSSLFAFSIHLDSPLAPSTFSHSPCMACLQRPLHVRTPCENPVPRTLNQTVWMQRCPVRFVPIQFDCYCNLVVARLVQRISRLGDKLRIKQIDFIREISPVRCASQLCLLNSVFSTSQRL